MCFVLFHFKLCILAVCKLNINNTKHGIIRKNSVVLMRKIVKQHVSAYIYSERVWERERGLRLVGLTIWINSLLLLLGRAKRIDYYIMQRKSSHAIKSFYIALHGLLLRLRMWIWFLNGVLASMAKVLHGHGSAKNICHNRNMLFLGQRNILLL